MAWTLGLHPSAIVGASSAIAMIVVGALVIIAIPRKADAIAGGTFALLIGGGALFANLSQMATSVDLALFGIRVSGALYVMSILPLGLGLGRLMPRAQTAAARLAIGIIVSAPVALILLLLALDPGLYVSSAVPLPSGFLTSIPGPLFLPLGIFASIAMFVVALTVAAFVAFRDSRPAARSRAFLVVAALLTYVSYRSSVLVGAMAFGDDSAIAALDLGTRVYYGSVLALGLFIAVGIPVLAFRQRVPWWELIVACAAVPLATGFAEIAIARNGASFISTIGLWRLAMVALFAYAIVRYRLFDVEVKMRALASPAAYVIAALIGLAALWTAYGARLVASPGLATFASLGILAAIAPAHRLGPAILDRLAPRLTDRDYLYKRKLDVYRAALEEAQSRGMGSDTEQLFLSDLRRGLKISEQEHRILLLVLQSQDKYGRLPVPAAPTAATKFRVERELGRGSFARALLAEDATLGRKVVLKQPIAPWLLDGQGREAFLREARVAASIRHPNVVAIYEVRPDDDPPTIVMEHVSGGSVEDLLAREPRLDAHRAVALVLGVLDGLGAIHAAGIVHRDLKPANILLDADGAAKVADFGIAQAAVDARLASTMVAGGTQPGSVAYMSPEQARGDAVDARSDLYAAGVLLHRTLSGRHYIPHAGRSVEAFRRAIASEAPDLAGISPALARILERALSKDPAQRYATASQMADALRETARVRVVPVTTSGPPTPAERSPGA